MLFSGIGGVTLGAVGRWCCSVSFTSSGIRGFAGISSFAYAILWVGCGVSSWVDSLWFPVGADPIRNTSTLKALLSGYDSRKEDDIKSLGPDGLCLKNTVGWGFRWFTIRVPWSVLM